MDPVLRGTIAGGAVPVSTGPNHVPVEGCVNFRDAGGWTNGDGRRMRTGRLFRSDDPIRITERGRATVDALGLAAVVDVRQHHQFVRSPGFVAPARTFHRPLVDQVIDVQRPPRFEVPSDLTDLYDDMIDRGRAPIADAVDLLAANLAEGPVLVHCAYGKDRTGIIVALVQAALGMSPATIVEEYARSDAPSRRRYEWVTTEPLPDDPPIGRTPLFFFTAPSGVMAELLQRVSLRHGSLDGWLATFPFATGTLDSLRTHLLT